MSLTVSDKGGGSFPEIQPGSYLARCIRLIDLGTQEGNEFNGEKKAPTPQILVMWELPTELVEGGDYDGQPRTMSFFYTASLGEKANLRKHLEAWRGKKFTDEELKGFSLTNILGHPCMLSVVHSDKGKAKISSVSQIPKGLTCPPRILPLVSFDLSLYLAKDLEMLAIYNDLSNGVKKKIGEALEFKQAGYTHPPQGDYDERNPPPPLDDDSIPF